MPVKHIHRPVDGIVTAIEPNDLVATATPLAKGVILKDGAVRSDFGYAEFPVAGTAKTNFLAGTVMKVHQFFKFDEIILPPVHFAL